MDPPDPGSRMPVALVPGMLVYEISELAAGRIAGVTEAYAIYRMADSSALQVSRWRELAIGNLVPLPALLSTGVHQNDVHNAQARALRELLALERLGALSQPQQAALDELIALLDLS